MTVTSLRSLLLGELQGDYIAIGQGVHCDVNKLSSLCPLFSRSTPPAHMVSL